MDLANKPPPPASQLNAQDVVELIDDLIKTRDAERDGVHFERDRAEIIKRLLTDYFLAADGRKGIYVKGPNDG